MSLIAVLKTSDLSAIVKEIEVSMGQFPDMIELENRPGGGPSATVRQFFRIGITENRATYREGISLRVQE